MKILIITSCTGEKQHKPDDQLTLDDFRRGAKHVQVGEKRLQEYLLPAGQMYTGQQHVRLMRGVESLREKGGQTNEIDLWVLSAGYGLIPEDQKIAPYESTFQGMKVGEIRDLGNMLNVPADFRRVVSKKYDLGLVLLGDSYLRACALDENVSFGGPTVLFCGTGMAKKLPNMARARAVPVSNPEAKRFSCGLVGLKGELAGRILGSLPENLDSLIGSDARDVLTQLDTKPSRTARPGPRANPKVDLVIQIPRSWHELPHRSEMRYFIPDWDDQVDPDFDFETDTHSGGSGDWSNQVYAHQMFPEPNYDGILVSKVVAEQGKKKKARVNEMGIHRFLRVPRSFPVMGDCGAFGYIKEEVPPYDTPEILDYYTRLDFDFGVSIDHLIVTQTEEDAKFRYDLTISNAEEFLNEHQARGLDWVPIGAIQGWDPGSYARAAKQYVKMGYRYIALGGLVRTSTKSLLPILQAVNDVVPSDIDVHLFGVARENAVADLRRLGINSVDSASVLRKAWLGSDKNYLAENGWYSAIRIPEVNGSFRAKRLVSEGMIAESDLKKLEGACLSQLRRYSSAKPGAVPAELVNCLTEYDALIAGHRQSAEDRIRRTLEDRPWDQCPCAICRDAGVEVVIFRGNNRNRRRGFHNTYTFYRLFGESVLKAEMSPSTVVQSSLFSTGGCG